MQGKILFVDKELIWLGKGRGLYKSTDNGKTWIKHFNIPCSVWQRIALLFPLLERLFRLGFHHFCYEKKSQAICCFNKSMIWLDLELKNIISEEPINGSRPLTVLIHKGKAIYGEYTSNEMRRTVNLYYSKVGEWNWKSAFSVNGVRHIHGIYYDPFKDNYWLTTGDNNDESQVIILDNKFKKHSVLLQGSQQTRVVEPLFTRDYIYFATDAPDEQNFIYRYERSSACIEKQNSVGGPIYFGFVADNIQLFTTVAEPSLINSEKQIELWMNYNDEGWICINKYQKDKWPLKYFQYGQLTFPKRSRFSSDEFLFFSEFATSYHGRNHIIPSQFLINKYLKILNVT